MTKFKVQSTLTKFLKNNNISKIKIQSTIPKFFKKINKKSYGYNVVTDEWHCLECGESMGKDNPRQLCGKYFCHNK